MISEKWYALLDGPVADQESLKRHFAASAFTFDFVDEKFAVSAPNFADLSDHEEVIDEVSSLLTRVNAALRISRKDYFGFDLHALVRKRGDGIDRVMMARAGSYGLSGVAAVALAGSFAKPARSREERLVSLMSAYHEIEHVARDVSIRPITWSALTTTYETIVGLMSTKDHPRSARQDYPNLIERGWFTEAESSNFYHSAAYHRHGYPKEPSRASKLMMLDEARAFIDRIFWRFVDEKQPE